MRVRRALRTEAEYVRRLLTEGQEPELAQAASARLLQVLRDVRAAWAHESAGVDLGALRTHVSRWLAAMEGAAAGLAQPGADVALLSERFSEAGVPLIVFLRGLDDSSAHVLAELAGPALARSA
jgi:hypothetical protein